MARASPASHLLVATGRVARTAGLGLEAAGVAVGRNGITVDKYLRTSNARIFAIGDCRDGPRLTHAADQDARTVIQNALFPFRKKTDYSALPAATYTDPEMAQVGLTEAAGPRRQPEVEVWRHDFDHNDRSVAEGDMRGFVKIMALGNSVVGVTIVGAHAGELLALATFAVAGKLSLSDLANQTYAYPTLAEAIRFAAEQRGQHKLFTPFDAQADRILPETPVRYRPMSNAEQAEYWNSKVGETWARMQEKLDRSFTPLTAALLSLAAPKPGEHALDIGCGTGETTLALAGAVGDDGTVLGLDLSEQMLARARERAEELLSEAEFRAADVATFDEEDGFDLIISRFGVMFFDDPAAAFANLHRLAAPGGRLVFACWQGPTGQSLGHAAHAGAEGRAAAAAARRPARPRPLRLCRSRAGARHSRCRRVAGHRLPRL